MKDIEWQHCEFPGVIADYTPGEGRLPTLGDEVSAGMLVSAKYMDLDVYLEINSEIQENVFLATVQYFEPVLEEQPSDLDPGDEVRIDRQHICCLH